MSGAVRKPQESSDWTPPFDFSAFDRSPLTSEEHQVLQRRMTTMHGLKLSNRPAEIAWLRRFKMPIEVFLGRTTDKRMMIKAVTRAICLGMVKRGHSYWEWSPEEWAETVNTADAETKIAGVISYTLAFAIAGCGFREMHLVTRLTPPRCVANAAFGKEEVDASRLRLQLAAYDLGYSHETAEQVWPNCLTRLMLRVGSPRLEDIRPHHLEAFRIDVADMPSARSYVTGLSKTLYSIGIIQEHPERRREEGIYWEKNTYPGVDPRWAEWCRRWRRLNPRAERTKKMTFDHAVRTGLWLADYNTSRPSDPPVCEPGDWDKETCAAFIAAVSQAETGDWVFDTQRYLGKERIQWKPRSKAGFITSVRTFLKDLQEWEMIPLRFSARKHLAVPQSIERLIGEDPRDLEDAIWLKLQWASLNLIPEDFPSGRLSDHYPFEMKKAVAIVWTHAGLRSDEIVRLAVGSIVPQTEPIVDDETAEIVVPAGALAYMTVPPSKHAPAFRKPVHRNVLEAVAAWETVRPPGCALPDRRTGEKVDLLFSVRGGRLYPQYLNETIIPALIRRAGVPESDAKGAITSHRGRASVATLLVNGESGMSIIELMKWMGHKDPKATMNYARVRERQLARSFARADQTSRCIAVLVDQEAARTGAAAQGEPIFYYDLGDSYCIYDFWSTCPHRMVCPGCSFNVPKPSALGMRLAAKESVIRMLQEVPLTDQERTAAEGDLATLERIVADTIEVPTPDGRIPQRRHAPALTRLVQIGTANREPGPRRRPDAGGI
jgi:integrase